MQFSLKRNTQALLFRTERRLHSISFSDHRPIMLKHGMVDFGPTTFRIFNNWFGKDDFEELVEKTWTSENFS